MKSILILLGIACIYISPSASTTCVTSTEECHSTNYQTYVECVRKRHKRSTDCDGDCESSDCSDTCNRCDCDSCNYSSCRSSCSSCCDSCCTNYVPCRTHHCCHKTCHAQCSTSSCRSSCRRNCFETVKEKTAVVVESPSANITNINRHNVTTIIHLNNVINNTNVIDVPIVVNNTNKHNITLEAGDVRTSEGLTERCCTVISPRKCVSTPEPRCFHYRSRQCGPFCTANIVHEEDQQLCESYYPGAPPKCTRQVIYIPQPQPKCSYQSVWPYVSCGIQKEQTCQGCYSHYVNPGSTNYLGCPSQCYDDGFGMGSMYRQGPVYRPWYSHTPCYECLGYQNPYGASYQGYPLYLGGYLPQQYAGYQPIEQNGSIPVLNMDGGYLSLGQMGGVEIQPGQEIETFQQPSSFDGRMAREVEIEVKYQPRSDAQAEVKIKKEDSAAPESGKSSSGDAKERANDVKGKKA
ncbi:unnamed protein product [Phyllotreta striolata]|uniref:Uncharacterized protein n=1 Tax=Phyllotreta striolata TaxID=444603 RepID=A0A9N9XQY6_PHYSR|nr:unnamed protein product [Phyllotreta striolata]